MKRNNLLKMYHYIKSKFRILYGDVFSFILLLIVGYNSILAFNPTINNVEQGSWENITTVISVKNFGAKGDGVTDDLEAIKKACLAAASGNCTLFFPQGTYFIWSKGSPLSRPSFPAFKGVENLSIIGDSAIIMIDTTRDEPGFFGYLFHFRDCKNISITGLHIIGHHFKKITNDGGITWNGVVFVGFDGNSENISMPYNTVKNVAVGIELNRIGNQKTEVKNIQIGILKSEYAGYVLRCARTGNNLSADLIESNTAYRTLYLSDIHDFKARVVSKNNIYSTDVLLNGYVYQDTDSLPLLKNINIEYQNTETTMDPEGTDYCIGIMWHGYRNRNGLFQSAIMDGIYLKVDVRYNGRGSVSHVVFFDRLDSLDNFDPEDRGRVLKNFTLSGVINGNMDSSYRTPNLQFIGSRGLWGKDYTVIPKKENMDIISGFRINDLTVTGNTSSKLLIGRFTDSPILENVFCENTLTIDNSIGGKIVPTIPIVYRKCTAKSFSESQSTSRSLYEQCVTLVP